MTILKLNLYSWCIAILVIPGNRFNYLGYSKKNYSVYPESSWKLYAAYKEFYSMPFSVKCAKCESLKYSKLSTA